MYALKTIFAGALLATCASVYGQTQTHPPVASTVKPKVSKTKPKTEVQVLLEQLNDKFHKIEMLNEKYDNLQQRFDAMQQRLNARDAELSTALKNASEAQKQFEASQQANIPANSVAATLQTEVTQLKKSSEDLKAKVDQTAEATNKLAHPETLHFRGIELTPGGFVAAETVNRQRAVAADVSTPFGSTPFARTTSGVLSEFNASGRQSRISLLAEGKLPSAILRGYWEADFLSAGASSNSNESNSYTLRQRQAWAQAVLASGWTITGGQMWSLATEYNHGLENLSEALPLTIDAQYNSGFSWARQYGFRVVKQLGNRLWVGGAVEESQLLNIGGRNFPTLTYQQTGNAGGTLNPSANYSMNYAPDLVAKAAFEPRWGHFEVFGVGRFFRARVFPNGPAPTGATQPASTSALGAFTSKATGGGAGVNGRVYLFDKKLTVGAHILAGSGIGRYSTSTLADSTAHPDGSLELLTGGSALGTLEWRARPRLDLYAYYGGEYAKRAYYATGYTVITPGPTLGQPILAGYGAPNNIVYGCYVETLPTSSSNGGGNVASGPSNCNADTRNIQEGTIGYWFRLYKGSHGILQQGIQYSYLERRPWLGIGNPEAGLTNSPKGINNMWFTSFRYYLPK